MRAGWHHESVSAESPYLLLDVDGVLNPFAAEVCPEPYREYDFFPGEEAVRLADVHGEWLRDLARTFDLVWATGWGHQADQFIAPTLGLAGIILGNGALFTTILTLGVGLTIGLITLMPSTSSEATATHSMPSGS